MVNRFFSRMSQLIRADAHGMLDRLEERSLLLKQNLREAEIEVDRKRAELEGVKEEEAELVEEHERLLVEMKALDDDIELALGQQKDDLARFAVRQLLPKRELARQVERRCRDCRERRDRLCETVGTQSQQLDALRGRVRVQLNAARLAQERHVPRGCDLGAAEEEVDLELLRRRNAPASGEGG